jgi:hypothetical protein
MKSAKTRLSVSGHLPFLPFVSNGRAIREAANKSEGGVEE